MFVVVARPEERERRSRTDKDGSLHRPSRFGRGCGLETRVFIGCWR